MRYCCTVHRFLDYILLYNFVLLQTKKSHAFGNIGTTTLQEGILYSINIKYITYTLARLKIFPINLLPPEDDDYKEEGQTAAYIAIIN